MSPHKIIALILVTIFAGCGKEDVQPKDDKDFFEKLNNSMSNNSTNNGMSNNGQSNNAISNNSSNNTTSTNNQSNNQTITSNPDIDILWVLDNSGSMCQEQEILRDNFRFFAEKMAATKKNFHMAVTTTHMAENYAPEPVAVAGRIQSTPQPIPGFDQTCIQTVGPDGKLILGDYSPLRVAMATALKCTSAPHPELETLTDENIICAVKGRRCEIPGICGGANSRCKIGDLFPESSAYRTIPKVLRAKDYQKNGELDVEKLVADFACMSFVGTRGHGIEKGLSAVLAATTPELTGGSVESPTNNSAPNHGFLREGSEFALAFLTDENDCSHNGTLDESSSCGDAICEYANIEGDEENSPLLKIADIKRELLANLRASKGRANFSQREIRVASLHGTPERYAGQTRNQCPMGVRTGVTPVCASQNGVAFSGDRYARFSGTFDDTQTFPSATDPVQGWLCEGDFSPAMKRIGDLFSE